MPKKIIAIIGVSAVLGILFDYFFYNKMPPGLAFPLYVLAILAGLFFLVKNFREKPNGDGAWISGGFFVLEPGIFDYIENEQITWEQEPMRNLAQNKQLSAYKHDSFWHCMDSLRDRNNLEKLWRSGNAPWKIWK